MEKIFNKYLTGLLLSGLIVVLLPACGGRKKQVTEDVSVITSGNFARIFQNKATDWEYFSSKLNVDFETGGASMSGNASLRMKRDSLVWVSVSVMGFEAARILITTDSLYVMQKLPKKTFMARGIDELENYIGASVTFSQFQNLLLGNLVLEPALYKWSESPNEGEFYLKARKDSVEVTQRYFFKNTEPVETLIRSLTSYGRATVSYSGLQQTNLKPVPAKFSITAVYSPQSEPVKIKTEISSPEFPTQLTFPFSVTSAYERITE